MPEQTRRPHPPRHFSSHLRQHHHPGKSRRNAHLSLTPSANYGTITESPEEVDGQPDFPLLESQSSHADSDGLYPPNACWTANTTRPPDPFRNSDWPVYHNIHMIRREIIASIDDPYSLDQLKSPRMNLSVVRPLVDQFYKSGDLSMVYCLLVNRTQFMREQRTALHHQTVSLTRALLCELVAEKVLRRYNECNPGPKGLLKLANILVAGFEPFQNAPDEVMQNNHHVVQYVRQNVGSIEKRLTTLEVAIVSESKSFLASSGCQKVVDAIYRGKLVYSPNSFINILPDSWKRRPISLYDPARAPLLNQYRLVVPRTRNAIEVVQFCLLLVLYLLVMEGRESRSTTKFTLLEGVFDVYALGWILDQIASMFEHGWQVYTQNLWSFLDVAFSGLFMVYFVGRMRGLAVADKETSIQWARTSLDALSCAAPVLIPRLAFNVMSENLVFLCLRSMLADFANLLLLVIWCFIGFLLSLKWLHNGIHEPVTIGKWMIWIWFGLDGTGIQRSPDFHWLLGPAIMIAFAFLGNTLFVTILVSMLSNTFSRIATNATQEMHFRRAVLTFQGVKSDCIFAYQPPFNLAALLVLWPLKWTLSQRWFHKVNVATVKVIGAPLLIIISLYERKYLWLSHRAARYKQRKIDWTADGGPREQDVSWWARTFQFWDLSQFSAHRDMQAVFDDAPPESDTSDDSDDDRPKHSHRGIGRTLREDLAFQFTNPFGNAKRARTFPVSLQKSKPTSPQQDQPKRSVTGHFDADGHHDADSESDRPHSHKKPNKRERLDSLVDLGEDGSGLHEANARLHKLEESMMKIEKMLLQVLSSDDPTNEEAAAQEDLADDISQDDISPDQDV